MKFSSISGHLGKLSKSKKKALQSKNPEVMAHRRRKIWAIMAKKELGKVKFIFMFIHPNIIFGYSNLNCPVI